MTQEVPKPPAGDMTTTALLARSPELNSWPLAICDVADLTPRVRRLGLTHPDLADFHFAPGQDVMVLVDSANGRIIRRRYSIRRLDRAQCRLDLHVITETDGPGARWALAARVGDTVDSVGPRGKITLDPGADWHLFVGDDVAAPGISAMVEALPAGARAIVVVEVASAEEELPVATPPDVDLSWTWLHRDDRPAGDPTALGAAVADLALPAGNGHAYVGGEAAAVAHLRATLLSGGMTERAVSAKAYWGRGRANASHGEPLRDPDQ